MTEKLYVKEQQRLSTCADGPSCAIHVKYRTKTNEASVDEVLAWVRRQVESGTIKGEVVETPSIIQRHWKPGIYIVIGPVSDGGEDR